MPPPRMLSTRTRVLLVFALTVLLPSLALTFFATRSTTAQRLAVEARIQDQCAAAARAVEEPLADAMEYARSELAAPPAGMDGSALAERAQQIERELPFAARVFYVNTHGEPVFPEPFGEDTALAWEALTIWGRLDRPSGVVWQDQTGARFSVCHAQTRAGSESLVAACGFDLDDLVMSHVAPRAEATAGLNTDLAIELVDGRGNRLCFGSRGAAWPLVHEQPIAPGCGLWRIRVHHALQMALGRLAQREAATRWAAVGVLLAAIVIGATLTFRAVSRELAAARMKAEFVSRVSHELRTPLTSIHMLAEMLSMGAVPSDEKGKEYLQTILAETQRLSRLIDNVLDFARIREGRKRYHLQEADLGDVVAAAVQAFAPCAAKHGVEIVQSIGDVPAIQIDPDAIEQLVTNLLSNALTYSPDEKTIAVCVSAGPAEAVIRVEDHGIGIAPEHQAKIFEEFYRVETGDTAEGRGAGMGLALCRHIVEAHAGRMRVDSAPGRGSVFSVHLPLSPSAEEAPHGAPDPHC